MVLVISVKATLFLHAGKEALWGGLGAAAGVAVSTGYIGAARLITAGGNKVVQAVTGKFDVSNLNSVGDYVGLALDVGSDLLSPGLTKVISKPLTKALTPLANTAAQTGTGAFSTTVSGTGNAIKVSNLADDGFRALMDDVVVSAPRAKNLVDTGIAGKGGYSSFNAFKAAYGSAGKGNAWHHIVEQGGNNVSRFGAETIHNANNLINVNNG